MSRNKRKWLDTAFVPHRMEMRVSVAWQAVPAPLRRVLDRLELEHMRHGGTKNGELFVSFTHFVDAGVSRRNILALLRLGEELGFLKTIRSDLITSDIRNPNQYRLTYLPQKQAMPTDDWRCVTAEMADAALARYRDADKRAADAVATKRAA